MKCDREWNGEPCVKPHGHDSFCASAVVMELSAISVLIDMKVPECLDYASRCLRDAGHPEAAEALASMRAGVLDLRATFYALWDDRAKARKEGNP